MSEPHNSDAAPSPESAKPPVGEQAQPQSQPGQPAYPPPPLYPPPLPTQPSYPPPPPDQPVYPPGSVYPPGTMYPPGAAPAAPAQGQASGVMAIIGFIAGLVSLPAVFIPCCGFIFGLVGIVLSALGIPSVKRRTFAIIGLVASVLAIVLSVVNTVGAIQGLGIHVGSFTPPTGPAGPTATPTRQPISLAHATFTISLSHLFAIDTTTGKVLWEQNDANDHYGWHLSGNLIYYLDQPATSIEAADATTGAIRWTHALPFDFGPPPPAPPTPVGATPTPVPNTNCGSFGLTKDDVSWGVDGSTVVVALNKQGSVLALHAADGTLAWSEPSSPATPSAQSGDFYANVVAVGGTAYVENLGHCSLDALSETTGQTIWRNTCVECVALTVDSGKVITYVSCPTDTTLAYCAAALDPATGHQLWIQTTNNVVCVLDFAPCYGGILQFQVDSGTLYMAVEDGYAVFSSNSVSYDTRERVEAINEASGTFEWTYLPPNSDGRTDANPLTYNLMAATGSDIYLETNQGDLSALTTAARTQVWSYTVPAGYSGNVFAGSGVLYVLSTQSELYSLDETSGAVQWSTRLS